MTKTSRHVDVPGKQLMRKCSLVLIEADYSLQLLKFEVRKLTFCWKINETDFSSILEREAFHLPKVESKKDLGVA